MIQNERSKGVLAALGVYTIWGFTLLASTLAQRTSTPMIFLMYRFDIAAVIMLLPLLFGKRKLELNRKKLRGLILLGLAEPVIYFPCEQFGMKFTNSSFTGIMIAVIPVFTMLLAVVVLGDRPSRAQWLFSLLSIGGVIWLTLIESGVGGVITPIGVLLLALAVISGGAYGILSRKLADCSSIYERTLTTILFGALFFTLAALFENRDAPLALLTPLRDRVFVLSALYVSILASVIGYTLLNVALVRMPIANVTSMNNLATVLAVISGVVFLHEPFSVQTAVAMAVVLAGIWGVQRFGPQEGGQEDEKAKPVMAHKGLSTQK